MDRIKGQLTEMFDEMRGQLGQFRRKTYAPVFKAAFEKYKDLLAEIEALCGEGSKEDQEQTVLEIASVIPDHGREEAEKMHYRLLAKSDMVSFVDSLVGPLSVINALIVTVAIRKKQEVADTLRKIESIWDEYSIYEKVDEGGH